MKKITPFLWFDTQAEEAMNFYVSVFRDSKITEITRYGEAGPGPAGSVMTVTAMLAGQEFIAMNAAPAFEFSLATSFLIKCETQEEVDWYWEKLSEGGEKIQCGWLKDKYGLPWQVTPVALLEMIADPDPVKSQRVMKAMMGMVKLDIAELKRAYEGE